MGLWQQQLSNCQRYSIIGISDWQVCYKAICVSFPKNQGTWHIKGSGRWSKCHSSLSCQGRTRVGHCFVIRHGPLLYDGMGSITLISFQFDCECNMQVDRVCGLDHRYSVLFCFFIVKSKFITLLYNLEKRNEKIGFIFVMLRFQSLTK